MLRPYAPPPRRRWRPLALSFLRLAVEIRLALFDEGADRFFEVRSLHRVVELDDFPLHDRRQVGVEEVRPSLALDRGERFGRVEGDLGGGRDGGLGELVGAQDLVHESDAACFGRVDDTPGEHQFHGLTEADDVHEQPGAGELRQHADADEAHRKPCALRGVTDVAGEGDREAGSDGDAVDRSDNRLRALDERDPVLAPVRDAHTVAGLFGALDAAVPALDVGAGAEALSGASEDDRTDLGILVVGLDRLPHLGVHGFAQGVQLVWVVQGDYANAASFFGEYLFVRHGRLLSGGDDYSTVGGNEETVAVRKLRYSRGRSDTGGGGSVRAGGGSDGGGTGEAGSKSPCGGGGAGAGEMSAGCSLLGGSRGRMGRPSSNPT